MFIPAGYAQVNMVFSGIGLPRGAQVAYGVLNTGPSNGPRTAPELAEFAKNTWAASMLSQQSISTILVETKVKLGPNATGADATVTSNLVGGSSAEQDSPQVAVLIRKRTPFGGKTGKGRMFVPGVSEGQTDRGGVLGAPNLVNFQGAANQWLSDHNIGLAPIVLLHTLGSPAPFIVTDLEVQKLLATQRRRLR
jgi:hypothetical protein